MQVVLAAVVSPLLFTAFCFPVELSVRNLLLLVIFLAHLGIFLCLIKIY